jgi:hypothetical protein
MHLAKWKLKEGRKEMVTTATPLIATRLVGLIEEHAEVLARGITKKLLSNERTADLRTVAPDELEHRVYEVLSHLSLWLMTKTEADIEFRYSTIGARRAVQGVRLSNLVWAISVVKEHLLKFLSQEAFLDHAVELFQQIELMRIMDQFFGRVLYYTAQGYEGPCSTRLH